MPKISYKKQYNNILDVLDQAVIDLADLEYEMDHAKDLSEKQLELHLNIDNLIGVLAGTLWLAPRA